MESDPEAVVRLLAQLEGQIGADGVAPLIDLFSTSAQSRLERLDEAAAAGDATQAALLAHSLAGSVGTMGAPQLRDLLRELEQRCRTGVDPDDLRASVADMRERFNQILDALADR